MVTISVLMASALLINGCAEDTVEPIYNPNAPEAPSPAITAIVPGDSGLAGVTDFTITGSNFSNDPSKVIVFFDSQIGKLLQASSTQLVVRPPELVKDSVAVRVSVQGAMSFSNKKFLKLKPAYVLFDSIQSNEEPYAVAIDAQGDLYVSLNANGIKKFTPEGSRSNFTPNGPPLGSAMSCMKFSPLDGKLYAVWGLNAIAILPGNNLAGQLWVPMPNQNRPRSLDFDASGNIWAAGSNTTDSNNSIVRVTPSKATKAFSLGGGVIRSLKVLNGYLYLAGTMKDSSEKVVRYQIVNLDSLGAQETVFDLASVEGGKGKYIYAMVFTAQGDILLGTDLSNSILKITNGQASVVYPDVFTPAFQFLTWGKNTELWGVRVNSTGNKLYKIETQIMGQP
ncbi:MAG: IPT/TIG domain-containing protein [Ignavibacteriales bacterium]|nr:IPT/TIG domain-containing protein [Ignavibacteriales bacterium]